mgnify:CR=1 FL=1
MLKRENHIEIDRRKFYKTVLALVVPMALQNLINVGVTAADVIMLGAVGEKALSGASLAGQIQYIMTLFLFGLTSGATVLTAQYWGKGDRDAIEKILGMAVKAAVCVTALFTVSALAVPELLMQVFTNDPVVVSEGVKYLRIVAFTYIMMGVTQAYLYIMRSVERVVVQYHNECDFHFWSARTSEDGCGRSGAWNSLRPYSGSCACCDICPFI